MAIKPLVISFFGSYSVLGSTTPPPLFFSSLFRRNARTCYVPCSLGFSSRQQRIASLRSFTTHPSAHILRIVSDRCSGRTVLRRIFDRSSGSADSDAWIFETSTAFGVVAFAAMALHIGRKLKETCKLISTDIRRWTLPSHNSTKRSKITNNAGLSGGKTTNYNHDSFIRNKAGIYIRNYQTVVSVVDLRSDTVTSPTRKMLEQALTARTGGM